MGLPDKPNVAPHAPWGVTHRASGLSVLSVVWTYLHPSSTAEAEEREKAGAVPEDAHVWSGLGKGNHPLPPASVHTKKVTHFAVNHTSNV